MKYPLLRFLCGSVRFTAKSEFPERFINLAMRSNASLWDIENSDDGFSASVIAARYKHLRSAARKTHTRIRLHSKHGLPFRLIPYRHRVGFVLGFIFFCLTIWTMSNFVWIIEYPDVDDPLREKVISAADSIGIRPGCPRSSVDSEALATLLELNVSELSWSAVNIFGSRISIDVRRYEELPEMIPVDEPCNLVASKGGVIVDVRLSRGFAEVCKGDVVAPGDLLISGVIDDAMGSVSLVHASGTVTARTDYRFVERVSFEQTEPLTTGRVFTVRRLGFFGFELPMFIGKEPEGQFIRSRTESPLILFGQELPVSYIEENWTETAEMTHTISERDAESRALALIQKRVDELGDIEVISRTEYVTADSSGVTVTVDFTVYQNIAVEENILFD